MLQTNGVEAIFFDLDGTLRHSRPSPNHLLLDFAGQLGVPDSVKKRRQAMRWAHYYWAQSPELVGDRKRFDGQEDEFRTNFARRYLIAFQCPPEEAHTQSREMYERILKGYQPEHWVPPDVPETLNALKEAGFTLGVISNRRNPIDEELETLGLQPYLSFAITAGEVNAWKPSVEIFQHALQRSGSEPEHTIYVGDNYFADVIGAQRTGIQPVLIDPDGLFPEAKCTIINTVGELTGILL